MLSQGGNETDLSNFTFQSSLQNTETRYLVLCSLQCGLDSTVQSFFFVVSQTNGMSISFLTLAKLHWLPLDELANASQRQTPPTCLGFPTPIPPRVCLVPLCQSRTFGWAWMGFPFSLRDLKVMLLGTIRNDDF